MSEPNENITEDHLTEEKIAEEVGSAVSMPADKGALNEDAAENESKSDDDSAAAPIPLSYADTSAKAAAADTVPEDGAPAEAAHEVTANGENESDVPAEPTPEKSAAAEPVPESSAAVQEPTSAAETEASVPPAAERRALSNEEVTGHTASLWKYLPIPASEPEPLPEYINYTVSYPGSRVIGARVRGKKHKHEGTNCDDWFETANYGSITFVAVSDGAGSKKFSRIGARESCKSAVGYLLVSFEKLFDDYPHIMEDLKLALTEQKCMDACGKLARAVQQSVIKAHEAVEAAFYSRKSDPAYDKLLGRGLQFKDLSGTLLIAVLIPINTQTKEHLVISCQIGDGMIAILNSKGSFEDSLRLMGVPDSGDFSGETDFLTSPQMKTIEALAPRTKISRTVVDTLMVMTDGVADDYFPYETEMRRLYFDLIANGVLGSQSVELPTQALSRNQLSQYMNIPEPLAYPWVNDPSVKVPIQYTNRIISATGLTLKALWENPTALYCGRPDHIEAENAADPSERLKIWLDNYVERGSFDDRTLVLATIS